MVLWICCQSVSKEQACVLGMRRTPREVVGKEEGGGGRGGEGEGDSDVLLLAPHAHAG